MSYTELARKHGRSRDTIIKLRAKLEGDRPERKKSGPTVAVEETPISDAHRALGIRLTIHRGGKNFTQMGELLNVSRVVVRKMELGQHDFSLTQVQTLAKEMGMTMAECLEPYKPISSKKGRA